MALERTAGAALAVVLGEPAIDALRPHARRRGRAVLGADQAALAADRELAAADQAAAAAPRWPRWRSQWCSPPPSTSSAASAPW